MTYDMPLLSGGTSLDDHGMAQRLYGHDERSPFPLPESRPRFAKILNWLAGWLMPALRLAGWR